MQRYRHYGTYAEEPHSTQEVPNAHQEEHGEPVINEEAQGGASVEEAGAAQQAPPLSEAKPPPSSGTKIGKKATGGDAGGGAKYSVFTWFAVLALLGVWSSVAVVYFDIVDYDSVIARAQEFRMNFSQVLQGKLTAYDTDGDGDFDVEDAKVLLGLTKDGGASAPGESLEEVVDILAEEGSDWMYGFFTFLYDVVSSPVEQGEEEEEDGEEEEEDGEEEAAANRRRQRGGASYLDDVEVKGVILDLQNQ